MPAVAAAVVALAMAALGPIAHAQSADTIQAVKLAPHERLTLNGTLAHPAWARAPVYERFVEKFPNTGAVPSQATRVQVLFDDQALWVGITALDTEPGQIRRVPVRADGVNRTQDFVVAYVDPIGAKRSAQFFRVNAAGSLADGMHTAADDSEDFAPDFDWDAAVAPHPEGWTAVLRLPFASLRFAEGTQAWRFMVARRLPREQFHLFTSVLVPRSVASFIDTMQPLSGIELPEQHAFLTLRPSVTVRTSNEGGRRENKVESSLDLKWRPRAELVIDGALNPDFSQVALDVPQLSGNQRFALFLTEKRPFFFESADLLRAPTEAVYTRSITAPRGGLRATWRGARWAGTAFAIDDRGGGLVLLPGPFATGFAPQPAARSLSARAKGEVGDGGALQWGFTAAARRYAEDAGDNEVIGPDAEWAFAAPGGPWRLRTQWLHSRTTALPDANGRLARAARAEQGDRLYARLARNSGHGETALEVDHLGRGLRHDGGFVDQNGVRRVTFFQSHGWQQVGPLNELYINVEAERRQDNASGQVVQDFLRPGLWATGPSNLEARLNFFVASRQRVAAGRPLLESRYVNAGVVVTPARWFPLLDASLDAGRLADTVAEDVRDGTRAQIAAKLRPLVRLELEPSLSFAALRDAGALAYREVRQQWLAVWHFDARHTLRLIEQRGALDRRAEPARGVAEQRLRGHVESITYAWRRSAGTVFYLGATRSRADAAAARVTEAFAKLQFDVDDVWR